MMEKVNKLRDNVLIKKSIYEGGLELFLEVDEDINKLKNLFDNNAKDVPFEKKDKMKLPIVFIGGIEGRNDYTIQYPIGGSILGELDYNKDLELDKEDVIKFNNIIYQNLIIDIDNAKYEFLSSIYCCYVTPSFSGLRFIALFDKSFNNKLDYSKYNFYFTNELIRYSRKIFKEKNIKFTIGHKEADFYKIDESVLYPSQFFCGGRKGTFYINDNAKFSNSIIENLDVKYNLFINNNNKKESKKEKKEVFDTKKDTISESLLFRVEKNKKAVDYFKNHKEEIIPFLFIDNDLSNYNRFIAFMLSYRLLGNYDDIDPYLKEYDNYKSYNDNLKIFDNAKNSKKFSRYFINKLVNAVAEFKKDKADFDVEKAVDYLKNNVKFYKIIGNRIHIGFKANRDEYNYYSVDDMKKIIDYISNKINIDFFKNIGIIDEENNIIVDKKDYDKADKELLKDVKYFINLKNNAKLNEVLSGYILSVENSNDEIIEVNEKKYLNLFRGFKKETSELIEKYKNVDILNEFVNNKIADEMLYRFKVVDIKAILLFYVFAYFYDEKPNVSLMLHSEKTGMGKGFFLSCFNNVFGNSAKNFGLSDLVGNFNSEIMNYKLCVVEEMHDAGSNYKNLEKELSATLHKLKDLITNTDTFLNQKFKNPIPYFSTNNYIFCFNNRKVIDILNRGGSSYQNERRMLIIHLNEDKNLNYQEASELAGRNNENLIKFGELFFLLCKKIAENNDKISLKAELERLSRENDVKDQQRRLDIENDVVKNYLVNELFGRLNNIREDYSNHFGESKSDEIVSDKALELDFKTYCNENNVDTDSHIKNLKYQLSSYLKKGVNFRSKENKKVIKGRKVSNIIKNHNENEELKRKAELEYNIFDIFEELHLKEELPF